MTGETFGFVMEKALNLGVLDVFYTPIYMKKNRPAIKMSIICREDILDKVKELLFKETSTIGFRYYSVQRECMNRRIEEVNTPYGIAKVKVSTFNDITKVTPEYEDCKRVSLESGLSLIEVYNIVKNQCSK